MMVATLVLPPVPVSCTMIVSQIWRVSLEANVLDMVVNKSVSVNITKDRKDTSLKGFLCSLLNSSTSFHLNCCHHEIFAVSLKLANTLYWFILNHQTMRLHMKYRAACTKMTSTDFSFSATKRKCNNVTCCSSNGLRLGVELGNDSSDRHAAGRLSCYRRCL